MPENKALQEELEALQVALKTEEDGYHYYQEAADRSQHPLVKKFFAAVANDDRVFSQDVVDLLAEAQRVDRHGVGGDHGYERNY